MANWKLVGTSVVSDEDAAPANDDTFDPTGHTIDEVKQYISDNPDDVQRVYDLEAEGKARSTLLEWLTGG